MRNRLLMLITLAAFAQASVAEKRSITCKTSKIATSCYTAHGRLAIYNGGAPNFRLWNIGTNHLYGIFTNAADMRCTRGLVNCHRTDEENPDLPKNLQRAFDVPNPFDVTVYADFEVCPLELHILGHMQAACIESATHLVVKKD